MPPPPVTEVNATAHDVPKYLDEIDKNAAFDTSAFFYNWVKRQRSLGLHQAGAHRVGRLSVYFHPR
jgi:hypothetical protein